MGNSDEKIQIVVPHSKHQTTEATETDRRGRYTATEGRNRKDKPSDKQCWHSVIQDTNHVDKKSGNKMKEKVNDRIQTKKQLIHEGALQADTRSLWKVHALYISSFVSMLSWIEEEENQQNSIVCKIRRDQETDELLRELADDHHEYREEEEVEEQGQEKHRTNEQRREQELPAYFHPWRWWDWDWWRCCWRWWCWGWCWLGTFGYWGAP